MSFATIPGSESSISYRRIATRSRPVTDEEAVMLPPRSEIADVTSRSRRVRSRAST